LTEAEYEDDTCKMSVYHLVT